MARCVSTKSARTASTRLNAEDVEDVIADVPLSDSEWAQLLCVHTSQISRWRRGRGAPARGTCAAKVLTCIKHNIANGADPSYEAESIGKLMLARGWGCAVMQACREHAARFSAPRVP